MTTKIPFAGCFSDNAIPHLVFFGIADDTQSTYLGGCAGAPEAIRSAYDGQCYNATTETGVDLYEKVVDLGDLTPKANWEESAYAYRAAMKALAAGDFTPFVAGGDHAVTIPLVQGMEALGEPIHVIQIDAHPDLYPDFEGNRFSHACTGARLLEMDHVATLTQLGIRTLNGPQIPVAEKHGERLRIFHALETPDRLPELDHIAPGDSVYITVDMDGFDPAFAPGVSHAVPGGLSSRQVFELVQRDHWNLVGMDVVEVNPARDVNDQTAVLAARLLHEGMGVRARAKGL